jgi:cytidylate kinase
MIIAVDGPAGAGKGTVSRAIASHFTLKYFDTGLVYRAIAYKALSNNIDLMDKSSITCLVSTLTDDDFLHPALRTEDVGNAASKIAVLSTLRKQITEYIRGLTLENLPHYRGIILDGRDIGTVVCPHADIKIFITATADVRAARRSAETGQPLLQEGQSMVTKLKERDHRDKNREISPLVPADDAVILDTSTLSIEESCQRAFEIVSTYLLKSTKTAVLSK